MSVWNDWKYSSDSEREISIFLKGREKRRQQVMQSQPERFSLFTCTREGLKQRGVDSPRLQGSPFSETVLGRVCEGQGQRVSPGKWKAT